MVVDGGAIAHLTLLISNTDTKLKRQVLQDTATYVPYMHTLETAHLSQTCHLCY